MNMSFYSAAVGARAQQEKLNVVANNMANISTEGYKEKSSSFSDLVYTSLTGSEGQSGPAVGGSGTRLDKTSTIFDSGAYLPSESKLDFYIEGRGFFGLLHPETKEVVYTRNGNFSMAEKDGAFFLTSADGYFVLGEDGKPMTVTSPDQDGLKPAVYDFPIIDGLSCMGETNFQPTPKNGEAVMVKVPVSNQRLESSNVDLAKEMTKVMESQRAYQYSLKMVQTSDEIQNLINTLRE